MPQHVHHREHVADAGRLDSARSPVSGFTPAIGKRRGHDREVARRDEDRALAEIEIERFSDVALEHARVEHHVGDGAVAVPGVRSSDR